MSFVLIIKTALLYFFNLILYLISKLIPKKKEIWVFGCWFGNQYSDNSKYVFDYLTANQPHIRAIWLTRRVDIRDRLKARGCEAHLIYSPMSLVVGMRAAVVFVSHSNFTDCMPFLNNGKTKIIQLWHGSPIKKIGLDDLHYKEKFLASRIKASFFPFAHEVYDLVIARSKKDAEIFRTAFRSSNISIVGYPRNDPFVTSDNSELKNITYLPTFRGNVGQQVDLFSVNGFDLRAWERFLAPRNLVLNVKLHPVNEPTKSLAEQLRSSAHFRLMDRECDVPSLLSETSLLITDYSSIYFDYLLRDSPIIFFSFDLDNYFRNEREFYYKYEDVTPGPIAKTWHDVLKYSEEFYEGRDPFARERETIKSNFHKYFDGKSSERVFRKVESMI